MSCHLQLYHPGIQKINCEEAENHNLLRALTHFPWVRSIRKNSEKFVLIPIAIKCATQEVDCLSHLLD